MKTNLATDIIPVSDLMHEAGEIIKQLKRTGRPVLITQNGRAAMVCLDVGAYQGQRKRLEIVDAILSGERAFAAGDFSSWKEFESELERM